MSTDRKRLVAISHSCILRINRAAYHEFASGPWDVELITAEGIPGDPRMPAAEAPFDGDSPLHLLQLTSSNPRTYTFRNLERKLDELKPDIIVLETDPISKLAMQCVGWRNRVQRPVPITCISCENFDISVRAMVRRLGIKSIPASLAKKWMCWNTMREIDHVFTINEDGSAIFKRLGFRGVSKIPLGFDPRFFHIDEQSRHEVRAQLKLDGIAFAYFGRCMREKGIHLLLEALASLLEFDWHLILDEFESKDDYSNELKVLIDRLALADRIRFIHSKHGEIARYMNAADVVVVPSISGPRFKEQYGRVIPEAMACGKLIVASQTGALPELVSDKGILFPEGDVDALKDALKHLLVSDSQVRIRQSVADYAMEELSIPAQVRKMTRVFERLLGDR